MSGEALESYCDESCYAFLIKSLHGRTLQVLNWNQQYSIDGGIILRHLRTSRAHLWERSSSQMASRHRNCRAHSALDSDTDGDGPEKVLSRPKQPSHMTDVQPGNQGAAMSNGLGLVC